MDSSAYAFTFAATLSALEKSHEWRRLVCVTVLLVFAMQLAHWQLHKPIADTLYEDITPDGVVLQTSGSSCMAASGANIARDFGIPMTEQEMAEHMGTGPMGTSVSQFVSGMWRIGIECDPVFVTDLDPGRLSLPAELRVMHSGGPHAVAFLSIVNGTAEILDPLKGRVYYTRDELQEIWSGGAIECRLRSSSS